MVEKTKEKSTEKVHFIVRAIFVTQRIKRVVQPQDRQKVRINELGCKLVASWLQNKEKGAGNNDKRRSGRNAEER